MKQQTLKMIRSSIENDYLPVNWHESKDELIETHNGYYALQEDCVNINNTWYHSDHDCDQYFYDEFEDEYDDDTDNMVQCYGKRGNQYITNYYNDYVICHNDEYYHKEYLSDNNLVEDSNGNILDYDNAVNIDGEYYDIDDCYYWESDNEWHLEQEEPEEEPDDMPEGEDQEIA